MSKELVVIDQSVVIMPEVQRALTTQNKPRCNIWKDLNRSVVLGKTLFVPTFSNGNNVIGFELRDICTMKLISSNRQVSISSNRYLYSSPHCIDDGRKLILFSMNWPYKQGHYYVWDVQSGERQMTGRMDYAPDDAVITAGEKSQLYFAANDYINKEFIIRRLNWKTGYQETLFNNHKSIYTFDIRKDGKQMLIADSSECIKAIDTQSGKVTASMFYCTGKGKIRRISMSKKSGKAVVGSDDGVFGVIDMLAKRVLLIIDMQVYLGSDKPRVFLFEHVKISGDDAYAAVVYKHISNNQMGITVWDIAKQEVVFELNNETAYSFSCDDRKKLKSFAFSDEEIDQMCGEYRKTVLQCAVYRQYMAITGHISTSTSQCPISGKIGFLRRYDRYQGSASEHKKIMQILDINRLEFDEMIYTGRWFDNMHYENDRALVRFANDDIEYFDLWDLNEKKRIERKRYLEQKHNRFSLANQSLAAYRVTGKPIFDEKLKRSVYHEASTEIVTFNDREEKEANIINERVIGMNAKLIITEVNAQQKLNVYTRQQKYIGSLKAPKNGWSTNVLFSNYSSAFYIFREKDKYTRYVIDDAGSIQADSEYSIPSALLESFNGRYIFTNKKYLITLYDTEKKLAVLRKEPTLPDLPDDSSWIMKTLDREMRFLMIDSGDGRFDFVNPFTLESLATLHLMWQGKWLWTTPPDDVAPDGWFYTNVPEMLNIYRESADGGAEVLGPKDPARAEYIMKYGRKDMVKKRLLLPKSFKENIDRISRATANRKRLDEMRLYPILPFTDKA